MLQIHILVCFLCPTLTVYVCLSMFALPDCCVDQQRSAIPSGEHTASLPFLFRDHVSQNAIGNDYGPTIERERVINLILLYDSSSLIFFVGCAVTYLVVSTFPGVPSYGYPFE